jgi:hypothetical protein
MCNIYTVRVIEYTTLSELKIKLTNSDILNKQDIKFN